MKQLNENVRLEINKMKNKEYRKKEITMTVTKTIKYFYILRTHSQAAAAVLVTYTGLCLLPWQTGCSPMCWSEVSFQGSFTLSLLPTWSEKPSRADTAAQGKKLGEEDRDFSKCWAIFRNLTPKEHRLRVTPSGLITGTAQHTVMLVPGPHPDYCRRQGVCGVFLQLLCFESVCNLESALGVCNEPIPLSSPLSHLSLSPLPSLPNVQSPVHGVPQVTR